MTQQEHDILQFVIKYQNAALKAIQDKNAPEYTANLNRIIGIGTACQVIHGRYSQIYKDIDNRLAMIHAHLTR